MESFGSTGPEWGELFLAVERGLIKPVQACWPSESPCFCFLACIVKDTDPGGQVELVSAILESTSTDIEATGSLTRMATD